MGVPNRVDVQFFHQLDIPDHIFPIYRTPFGGMLFMAIDTFHIYWHTIDMQLRIFYFDLTETRMYGRALYRLSSTIVQSVHRTIQIGNLTAPLMNIGYFFGCLDVKHTIRRMEKFLCLPNGSIVVK